MSSIESAVGELTAAPPATPKRSTRRRTSVKPWRVTILALAALFFLGPILASIKYSLLEKSGSYGFANYLELFRNSQLRDSLYTSLEIAAVTAVVVVALLLPTIVLVRLKLPRWTMIVEGITVLPIVIPPVVIAAGLAQMQGSAPLWLVTLVFNHPLTGLAPFYVILCMPLVYRSIDTGIRAIDLHTLVDASRSLGAGWTSTLLRVILPNVRTAVLGGMFLAIAMCLGEVVLATFLLYTTFPVELIQAGQEGTAGVSVALSILALGFTFVLLFLLSFLAGRRGVKPSR